MSHEQNLYVKTGSTGRSHNLCVMSLDGGFFAGSWKTFWADRLLVVWRSLRDSDTTRKNRRPGHFDAFNCLDGHIIESYCRQARETRCCSGIHFNGDVTALGFLVQRLYETCRVVSRLDPSCASNVLSIICIRGTFVLVPSCVHRLCVRIYVSSSLRLIALFPYVPVWIVDVPGFVHHQLRRLHRSGR